LITDFGTMRYIVEISSVTLDMWDYFCFLGKKNIWEAGESRDFFIVLSAASYGWVGGITKVLNIGYLRMRSLFMYNLITF